MPKTRKLKAGERKALLETLKNRFEENPRRHAEGLSREGGSGATSEVLRCCC